MNILSVCVIVKNEARYLPEWIEYHLLIGVQHFYIYDNGSEDDIRGALRLYEQYVTLIDWPSREQQQLRAYQHYFENYSHLSEWVAVIDADEFIRLRGDAGLQELLITQSPEVAGFEIPWVSFGTNGHKTRPAGLVIQNYTQAHAVAPQKNIKTICRTKLVDAAGIISPHHLPYLPGYKATPSTLDTLALHHYTLRSHEDVVEKVLRGDAWSAETQKKRWANVNAAVNSLLAKYDGGTVVDESLVPFAEKITRQMEMRRIHHDSKLSSGAQ